MTSKTPQTAQKHANVPKPPTCQAVPFVDREEAVGGDGYDGGRHEARLGVGCHVRHRRIGRELQHHDDVLLHLLREHQRRLQEKILFREPGDEMTGQNNGDQKAKRKQKDK